MAWLVRLGAIATESDSDAFKSSYAYRCTVCVALSSFATIHATVNVVGPDDAALMVLNNRSPLIAKSEVLHVLPVSQPG